MSPGTSHLQRHVRASTPRLPTQMVRSPCSSPWPMPSQRRDVATRPPPSSVYARGRPEPWRAAWRYRDRRRVALWRRARSRGWEKATGRACALPLSRAPGQSCELCRCRLPHRGSEAKRRNVTANLVSSLAGGQDLARLELFRLRSSYLSAMAAQIGLRAFMDAAGISCSQRLGDLVANLASPTEEQAVGLLCPRHPG